MYGGPCGKTLRSSRRSAVQSEQYFNNLQYGSSLLHLSPISTPQLFDVSSSFAMETIKLTSALPLNHASEVRPA